MVEVKKNERANVLKEVNVFAKSLGLLLECRKAHWMKVGKLKRSNFYFIA